MSDSEMHQPYRDRIISFQSDITDTELEPLSPLDDLNTSLQDIASESLLRASQRRKKPDQSYSPELPDVQLHRPEPIRWKIAAGNTSSRYDSERDTSDDNEEPIVARFDRFNNARQNVKPSQKANAPINVKTSTPEEQRHVQLASKDHPSAFTPVAPSSGKRVNFAKRKHKRKKVVKDLSPQILEPGAVDLSKYSVTANLWLEQVDRRTVEKSRSMYMAVVGDEDELPARIRSKRKNKDITASPQWVIARGRSLRRAKQLTSMSSIPRSPVSDGEFDYGERPTSPGRQVILFFKVGSKWKDLAWVLFESLLTESETVRMIKDIEIKHPSEHNTQIQDLLNRWWHRMGSEATIDELKAALDLVNMPYIQDETFGENRFSDAESDCENANILDISEIDDNDPNVSRYIEEYEIRSLNNSFDLNTSAGARGMNTSINTSLSADNIAHRLAQKGITPMHQSSSISSSSLPHSSSSLQGHPQHDGSPSHQHHPHNALSPHQYSREPVHIRAASAHQVDAGQYNHNLDTSRSSQHAAFVITQPQLERVDVSQPSNSYYHHPMLFSLDFYLSINNRKS